MSARLLDGRELASRLRRELRHRVEALFETDPAPGDGPNSQAPALAIIRQGDSEAAALYATSLERAARAIGIPSLLADADDPASQIDEYNHARDVAGIVVAQPFTDPAAGRSLVERIDPAKDVDGATPTNAGRLARGEPAFVPATALAVVAMLDAHGIEIAGRRAVVVGRSAVVGRPVASLLLARDATVVICHRATRNLARETRRADILVAAAGVPGLIRPEMVNRSAVVIDCGINSVAGGIAGDVDFAGVSRFVRALTPVPGGIGPVTPLMVLRQLVEAVERTRSA